MYKGNSWAYSQSVTVILISPSGCLQQLETCPFHQFMSVKWKEWICLNILLILGPMQCVISLLMKVARGYSFCSLFQHCNRYTNTYVDNCVADIFMWLTTIPKDDVNKLPGVAPYLPTGVGLYQVNYTFSMATSGVLLADRSHIVSRNSSANKIDILDTYTSSMRGY